MSRTVVGFGLLAALILSSGCVDRRFVFETDPPGSMVEINGKSIGPAPGQVSFTYYGTYRFVFIRDGYETLTCDETVNPPWYQFFPLEFVSENLLPFTIHDVRYIRKPLQWTAVVPPDDILHRGEQLRGQGQSIGTAPVNVPAPMIAPAPATLPPGPAAPSAVAPPTGVVPPPPPPPPMTK
jgi:hypothetical protein